MEAQVDVKCSSCGGFDFIDAIDANGQPYKGCANCRIIDPIAELTKILREVNARPTFDADRSTAKPCIICRTTTEPRDLVTIGKYTRMMAGNLLPGDNIDRPMCAACREATS